MPKPGVLERFLDAGVRDFLVSLHGLGETHDEVVCRKNASEKTIKAIGRMVELDIPFRFNCTISKPVIFQLPQIAQKAVEYGANAVTYIAFNSFADQESGHRSSENVGRYSDIAAKLNEAMDILDEGGIECNVRYLPMYVAEERHRKNFYNWQQLIYDHHEWDLESWMWTMMHDGGLVPTFRIGPLASRLYRNDANGIRDRYEAKPLRSNIKLKLQHVAARLAQAVHGKETLLREEALMRTADCKYKHHEACNRCALQNICHGFHGDYAEIFGMDEAEPITDIPTVTDPCHFIKHQIKIVEAEDEAWAL